MDGSCLLNVKSRNSSSQFSLMSKVASHSTTWKPKQAFFSGKRLYCPCLSFSEAVTKESLGLSSREADEGEEEVCENALRVRVKNKSVTLFYTTIGPFFVPKARKFFLHSKLHRARGVVRRGGKRYACVTGGRVKPRFLNFN